MSVSLSSPIHSDSHYTKLVNDYMLSKCPSLEHYSNSNTSGILVQTHVSKNFGKTSGPNPTNKVCTILIISNRISYGLLAMQEWTDVFLKARENDDSKYTNTELLVHLHLNNPLMRHWEIGSFEQSLIKKLDTFGQSKDIRYCIDFSAWLLNKETSALQPISNPSGDASEYNTAILGSRRERLATIPYGLLRAFGLHKALRLNSGSASGGNNDVYMIVDVEPTEALNPSNMNKATDTHPMSATVTTALKNRSACFGETWKLLTHGSSTKNVVYNRLEWKSNHAPSMVAQWYDAKYPDGTPYDTYTDELTNTNVKANLLKSSEVRLKMDLAMSECMTKLTNHMNNAARSSTYPSEPLLGFKMSSFTSPQIIRSAASDEKSAIGYEKTITQDGKTLRYVVLCNVMGIGSGEGRSIENNLKGSDSSAMHSGKYIWTSAWGVLKDIVVAKLALVNIADTGKPYYEPKVKITVGDIKDMGGIDSGSLSRDTVIVNIDPTKTV
ncbi:hypothetical protein [Vibrio rhizosphaerae]|uniref:Uncharacterized protein n=1 Tax=Vibrio rhizosphaerae TaxID=398736 RepID=A0ABU4IUA9_9VIBR|nr:hypothetical protein [Vibrio rhizosphaerae]MDW6092971.1 hypothetical protein [Vibrio rhizosphaerae]